jgi:hypothetical protein
MDWREDLARVLEKLDLLLERLDMSAQDDINAATAAITSGTADLTADAPLIQAALNAGVDTTALNAAIAPLNDAVAGINALAHPATSTTTVT